MNKPEAEQLYDSGKEPTVGKLLEQDDQIKQLKQKIASLTQDSTNSSKPPSSDGLNKKRYPKKRRPSGRKPGGQKGHKGKNRALLPVEEMDHVHNLYPDGCEECGAVLPAGENSKLVLRHQVAELPEIKPIMTEFRCYGTYCTCGHLNIAQLPDEVAKSNFGPRVHAAAAYLASTHNVTRRGMVEIMSAFFNLDISLGVTWNMVERVSNACEPVYESLKKYSAKTRVLNGDETGWKNNGRRRWLWAFVADICVVFVIAASRGSKVITETLGGCFGSKSDKGERFTERILTVTRTCRMQDRNPFEFLADLVTASFGSKPLPSLLEKPVES